MAGSCKWESKNHTELNQFRDKCEPSAKRIQNHLLVLEVTFLIKKKEKEADVQLLMVVTSVVLSSPVRAPREAEETATTMFQNGMTKQAPGSPIIKLTKF